MVGRDSGRGVLHPEGREMREETTRECGTGGVPHPLLIPATTPQPVPPSKVPPEEHTLHSHLPCALQGPSLLVTQVSLQRGTI